VHYKTARINDLDIFYPEAGPKDAPTILLLPGFATSAKATLFKWPVSEQPDGLTSSIAEDRKAF
jgi:pimeloyl-ACP methyl ester carboxylesterase